MKNKSCRMIMSLLLVLLFFCGCSQAENGGLSAVALTAHSNEAAASVEETGKIPPEHPADMVVVQNVDEFLSAIAPNTTIFLKDHDYRLSDASNYGKEGSEYYQWMDCYDGYELQISHVEGLTLIGETGRTSISTDPRYANVIYFTCCDDLRLESLVIGHTEKKGYCSGGVVYLNSCENVSIQGCKLFGCGTVGITAYGSHGIAAQDTDIYECTYNAVYVTDCYDVRLEACNIHDCGAEWSESVFTVNTSNGFAVVNSNIYANDCINLLNSNYSQQVYLLGCIIEDNWFSSALFSCEPYGPIVEDCSIEGGQYVNFSALWDGSDGMPPVDREGNPMNEDDLIGMKWRTSTYDGPVTYETEVELDETINEDGVREVRVTTTDEFLAAIGSDTVIYLMTDHIDLSEVGNFGWTGNSSYFWQPNYDGPELVIKGVENLSIIGENTLVEAKPRYANVLSFVNCENLLLDGIVAGHEEEPGSCSGGVIYLDRCKNVNIDNCGLYGCGIMGISAYGCESLLVKSTEIYDCSYGAVELFEVSDAEFENCSIHDCGEPQISLTDSRNIRYDGEVLLESGGAIYNVVDGQCVECSYDW